MKRQAFMLSVMVLMLTGLMFLPFASTQALASSSSHDSHEEAASGDAHGSGHDELPGEVPFDRPVKEIVESLAPMNESELFPCSDCHDEDWETDPERRDLDEPHDEIPGAFLHHDVENRWCLDCHSAKSRDNLRLINGDRVKFNEYYRVCEQCHRRIYREWKMGVHGKRTGNWNGEKEMMHCAQCHNPHNPPFQAIKPMPAPRKPLDIKKSDDKHASSADKH